MCNIHVIMQVIWYPLKQFTIYTTCDMLLLKLNTYKYHSKIFFCLDYMCLTSCMPLLSLFNYSTGWEITQQLKNVVRRASIDCYMKEISAINNKSNLPSRHEILLFTSSRSNFSQDNIHCGLMRIDHNDCGHPTLWKTYVAV